MSDSTLDHFKIAALVLVAPLMFAAGYGAGVRRANSDWVDAMRTIAKPQETHKVCAEWPVGYVVCHDEKGAINPTQKE